MSDKAPEDVASEVDAHQAAIENIETHINLKDASVASEAEIASLETEQQGHRDTIRKLEETTGGER